METLTTAPWLWLLAAAATIFVLFKKNLIPMPNFLRRPFEELISSQIVTDRLDNTTVADWIRKNNVAQNPVQVLLVKCTQNYLSKLGYRQPQNIDAERNLLFIMTAKDSNKILKFQLVSFGSMDENLQRLFNGKDELLLTD